MGGGLQPMPSGKKCSNRDSDQSLISVGSENDDEDLFAAKWKASIPAKKANSESNLRDSGKMNPINLGVIEQTEVLKSSALKDRMSIKPRGRKSSRKQSARRRLEVASPMSLPSLNEESPTKTKSDSTKTKSDSTKTKTDSSKTKTDSTKTKTAVTDSVSTKKSGSLTARTERSQPLTAGSVLGSSTSRLAGPSRPGATATLPLGGSVTSPAASKPTTAGANQTSDVSTASSPDVADDKNDESRGSFSKSHGLSGKPADVAGKPPLPVSNQSENLLSRGNNSNLPTTPGGKGQDTPSLKVTDPDSNVTPSPKEDYKLKRQNRSKTLPGGIDELPGVIDEVSPRIQRAKSHRLQSSPLLPPREPIVHDNTTSLTPNAFALKESSNTNISSNVKKLEHSRFTPVSQSGEPAWISMARRRQEENDIAEAKSGVDAPLASANVPRPISMHNLSSSPKSVFSSSSYSERKRGSFDMNASNPESAGGFTGSKQTSKDVSSARRESMEINVSDLSSRSAGSRVGDTHKLTSQSATRGQGHSAASVNKPDETATNPTAAGATSHLRSGSVKSPPTKTFGGNRSVFSTRSNSVKVPAGQGQGHWSYSSRSIDISSSPSKSEPKKLDISGSPRGYTTTTTSAPTPVSTAKPPHPSDLSSVTPRRPVVTTATTISSSISSTTSPTPSTTLGTPPTTSTHATPPTSPPSHVGVRSFPSSSSASKSISSTNKPIPILSISNSKSSTIKPISSASSVSVSSSSISSSSKNPVLHSSSANISSPISSSSSTKPAGRMNSMREAPHSPPSSSSSSSVNNSTSFRRNSQKDSSKPPGQKEEKSTTPAWRAGLQKKKDGKDVKIEIIENKPTPSTPQSSHGNTESIRKVDNSSVKEMSKNNESSVLAHSSVSASNRSSKVLDMVKNFQNLQVTS